MLIKRSTDRSFFTLGSHLNGNVSVSTSLLGLRSLSDEGTNRKYEVMLEEQRQEIKELQNKLALLYAGKKLSNTDLATPSLDSGSSVVEEAAGGAGVGSV